MPDLKWNGTTRRTVVEKAEALAERFYPTVEADLTDITDREFQDIDLTADLWCDRTVKDWEIQSALKQTKPDKCPGSDEITNRFLWAMGNPLIQALTALLNQCWEAEYPKTVPCCSYDRPSQTIQTRLFGPRSLAPNSIA